MIQTVLGLIPPEALGVCYPHEHLLGAPPAPYAEADPDLVLDSLDTIIGEVEIFKAAGGQAIVEMTPLDYQPNPQGLKQIAQATGIHIIRVTGFLKDKFCRPWVENQSISNLAKRFTEDIHRGAGVIKASSSLNQITPAEEKVFRAAAQAHLATGALISTHTEAGTMALEQIQLLTAEGVKPERILIGHLDRHLDLDLHLRIAEKGVYMGFDQFGKNKYAPDQNRLDFIHQLIARGHLGQILVSCDIARQSYWAKNGGMGFAYLLKEIAPHLPPQILKENPARALSLRIS